MIQNPEHRSPRELAAEYNALPEEAKFDWLQGLTQTEMVGLLDFVEIELYRIVEALEALTNEELEELECSSADGVHIEIHIDLGPKEVRNDPE